MRGGPGPDRRAIPAAPAPLPLSGSVFSKETRFGSQVGEIRFEILNLTNTAKFGNESTNNAVNLSSFGRISTQAGFMRIWQLTFRYRF